MLSYFHRLFDNGKHRHFIDYLAEVNSCISAIALFPQLFTLVCGGTSSGLSPFTFILISSTSCIWLAYGIHRHSPPLVISSSLNAFASLGILVMIFIK
ncbi:hypothetical protein HZC53_01250 [Candidatus Uhrbacteria bacterium]|nr:hypothetical protein [Candidatus Uhrbacteria bacterium]